METKVDKYMQRGRIIIGNKDCAKGAYIESLLCNGSIQVECEPGEVDRNHPMTNSFFAIYKINGKKYINTDYSIPHSFLDIDKDRLLNTPLISRY